MKSVLLEKQIPVLVLALSLAPAWSAEPNVPGIPNFHQVSENIFRGGQPANSSWSSLADLGIKLVVDLRLPSEHSINREEQAVQAAGMRYVSIPMDGFAAPSDQNVSRVLALLEESNTDGPVFVHCRRGSDRSGTVIACYRITHDHWENQKALQEAKSFGMYWIEKGMQHYILNFKPAERSSASQLSAVQTN
jgi:protein tyrosine/serine phosphatase